MSTLETSASHCSRLLLALALHVGCWLIEGVVVSFIATLDRLAAGKGLVTAAEALRDRVTTPGSKGGTTVISTISQIHRQRMKEIIVSMMLAIYSPWRQ